MSTGGGLLNIEPHELAFRFELMQQSSCVIHLTNKTEKYVAFKVKTTNPKQYSVRPNIGVILPSRNINIVVTMQAQKEAPPDMQCKDKFLVQSVIVEDGATPTSISADMFNKDSGNYIEEFKLRVVYLMDQTEQEEGISVGSSAVENGAKAVTFDSISRPSREVPKSSETKFMIQKLTEEKQVALQQNQKLRQELEVLRKESSKHNRGFSVKFVALVALLSILVGYLIKTT